MTGDYEPVTELITEKAVCQVCGLKAFEDVQAWADQHVRETGHAVALTFHHDVRDREWFDRLSYERQAEIERVRGKGRPPEE